MGNPHTQCVHRFALRCLCVAVTCISVHWCASFVWALSPHSQCVGSRATLVFCLAHLSWSSPSIDCLYFSSCSCILLNRDLTTRWSSLVTSHELITPRLISYCCSHHLLYMHQHMIVVLTYSCSELFTPIHCCSFFVCLTLLGQGRYFSSCSFSPTTS